MKSFITIRNVGHVALAAGLALFGAAVKAGVPLRTVDEPSQLKPGDSVVMVCPACKTVLIEAYQSPLANGRATPRWMTVGAQHQCVHCGGTITVVKGDKTDVMGHNCSKCGKGAAFCCALPSESSRSKR